MRKKSVLKLMLLVIALSLLIGSVCIAQPIGHWGPHSGHGHHHPPPCYPGTPSWPWCSMDWNDDDHYPPPCYPGMPWWPWCSMDWDDDDHDWDNDYVLNLNDQGA